MSESTNKTFALGTGNSVTQIIHVGAASQRQELKLSLNFDPIRAGRDHGLPRLLKWNGRISPLLGRDAVLTQLRAWLADPQGDPVQIVSGPGGVGKTRLAAEFALELRRMAQPATRSGWRKLFPWPKKPQPPQWKAGFVAMDDLGEALSLPSAEPALCILDYPEERPESLNRWINALADVPKEKRNLRVLFVTRDAETVKNAFRGCNQMHLFPGEAIKLVPVAADDGYRVLNGTLTNLAKLGYPSVTVAEADFTAWRKLSPLHESPLFVVALAIHLSGGDAVPTTLKLGGTRLLDALCEREETRLQNIGKAHGATAKDAAADVLAWATLLDKLEPIERAALCKALLPGQADVMLATLQASGALNANAPVLAHLEPDLLAAWWLQRWIQRLVLLGAWDDHAATLAGQMAQRTAFSWAVCVPHWNRLGYDLTSRLGQTPNAIDRWAAQHVATTWQTHAADVRATFELRTEWHGLHNAAVTASKVGSFPTNVLDESEGALAERARQLNNHAVYLADAGERDTALAVAQEAVEIYRRLAQDNPAAFEPDLAGSLNNLANRLSAAGERDAALAVAQEAVEIRRRLAQDNPAAFEPNLATSLNNLANHLSAAGERDAALAAAQEAVEIRRRLALDNPAAFEPDLAMSLNNLANRLSDAGERDAALAVAQEAVEIRRRLAQDNPAAFEPDLAKSLAVLAIACFRDDDMAAARAAASEALALVETWAQRMPAAFAGLRDAIRDLLGKIDGAFS